MPLGGRFTETDAEILQTRLLLEYGQDNLYDIALVREGAYEDDDEGGVVSVSDPSTKPEKRRFFQSVTGDPLFIVDADGQRVEITHVLISTLNDDIQARDTFTLDGRAYRVVYVDPLDRSQLKAFVREVEAP